MVVGAVVLVVSTVVVDVAGDVVVVTMVVVVPASVPSAVGVVVDGVDVVVVVRAAVVVLSRIVVAGGVVVVTPDVASSSPPHATITRVPAMRSSAGVFMWRGLVEWGVGGQETWCNCRRGATHRPPYVHRWPHVKYTGIPRERHTNTQLNVVGEVRK